MSLKKQTVSGVKWLVGSSFIQKAISFLTTVVLARIFNPSIFGLFALAFVAVDALGLFKSMGFDSALIRRKDNIEKAANTAFFIIPLLGFIIYLILAISAPFIGKFLNSKDVVGVLRFLGIIFIFNCFGRIPAALLEKNMQFKKISIMEISSGVVYSITAIILALFGFGIWSLVFGYIIKVLIQNSMAWYFSNWHPKFEFDREIAWEMFHFGKFIFLAALAWFLRMNLDNILVGKLLGVAALGLYAVAFGISNFGADYFSGKIYRVTFPAYSKLHEDLDNLRKAFLKVLKHISLVAFPLGIILFLLSKEFLITVYGEKWVGAVDVLKILASLGIFNTLLSGFVSIFSACGKPRIYFYINLIQVLIFVIFISPMAKLFGINGVGIVVGLSSFVAFIVALILAKRFLFLTSKQIFHSFRTPLLSSIYMTIVMVLFKKSILQFMFIPIQFKFVILLLLAIGVYSYSLFKIDKSFVKEIKSLIFI